MAPSFDVLAAVLLLFRCSAFCFPFSSISQCLHTLKELFVGRQQTIKHLRYIAYQQLRYGYSGMEYMGSWSSFPFDAVLVSYLIYPSVLSGKRAHMRPIWIFQSQSSLLLFQSIAGILKTHKIALCLPCQSSSFLFSTTFFFFLGLSSGVNLCKAP